MTRPVVRRWEASIARGDVEDWLDTFKVRAFPHMRAVRRYAGQEPARTVMPDFMAPFFPAYEAQATFHDEVMVELKG